MALVHDLAPGKWAYINLPPGMGEGYDGYLDVYVKTCHPKILSYDNYPIGQEGNFSYGFWANIAPNRGTGPRLPPMQPWAAEMNQQLQKVNTQNAGAYCLPQYAVPITGSFPYKVYQTKDALVSITEFFTPGWRQVFMDGRPHPPADEWNPAWHGHSIGYWDGDTLVVETVNVNARQGQQSPFPTSKDASVIERFTRVSENELLYQYTVENPGDRKSVV